MDDRDELARLFGRIAVRAGHAILERRAAGTTSDTKADGSPVTAADLEADAIIRERLGRTLPDVPVITEETCTAASSAGVGRFILVDPLDGTREFITGSAEFTVNIALIDRHAPVAGAVFAPALGRLYLGGGTAGRLDDIGSGAALDFGALRPIAVAPMPASGWRVVVSRSHLDPATQHWIDRHAVAELKPSGSSLKFCAVAEGEADVYPRLSPTMEWDTAAGHAVLLAAGGSVTGPDLGCLPYGKPGFRNGPFVAWGSDRPRSSGLA